MKDRFFGKGNYIGILIGIGLLIIGFYSLSRPPVNSVWTMNVAPIILCFAYCIVFPIAIMWNSNSDKKDNKRGA
jgi:hypothetical protein